MLFVSQVSTSVVHVIHVLRSWNSSEGLRASTFRLIKSYRVEITNECQITLFALPHHAAPKLSYRIVVIEGSYTCQPGAQMDERWVRTDPARDTLGQTGCTAGRRKRYGRGRSRAENNEDSK